MHFDRNRETLQITKGAFYFITNENFSGQRPWSYQFLPSIEKHILGKNIFCSNDTGKRRENAMAQPLKP